MVYFPETQCLSRNSEINSKKALDVGIMLKFSLEQTDRQTDRNVYLTKINKIHKIIFTKIAVGRPPLRLYIVALVEATLLHIIIHNKNNKLYHKGSEL